jgi:hypothetical protein
MVLIKTLLSERNCKCQQNIIYSLLKILISILYAAYNTASNVYKTFSRNAAALF